MALRLEEPQYSGSISVGSLVQAAYPTEFRAISPMGDFGPQDLFINLLNTSIYVADGLNLRHFLGATGGESRSALHENRGAPPVVQQYNPRADFQKYSEPIASAFDLAMPNSPARPVRENQVGHISLSGDVTSRVQRLYTFELGYSMNVYGLDVPSFDQSAYGYMPLMYMTDASLPNVVGSNFAPYGYFAARTTLDALLGSMHEMEHRLSPLPFMGMVAYWAPLPTDPIFGYGNQYIGSALTNVRYANGRLTFRSLDWGIGELQIIDATCTFKHDVIEPGTPASVLGRDILSVSMTLDYDLSYKYRIAGLPGDGQLYGWFSLPDAPSYHGSIVIPIGSVCRAFSHVGGRRSKVPDIVNGDGGRFVSSTYRTFADNLGDLRPSAMYSYADAMGKYRGLSSNYLETILEAEELLHILPDLLPLLRAFSSAERGDAVSAGLNLGDFFSSLYLQASFGWRPVASNAKELSTKIDRVGAAFRALQSPMTLNGKFTFKLPSFHGYDGVVLTTRTKLRVNGVRDDFLLSILKLDSIGLLPRSANIWDNVLFSWFFDYGVNLSGRLDVIDAVFFGLAMDFAYCTHSFTATGPIPDETLLSEGLERSSSLEPPSFTVYFREFSRHVPFIFESKVDFGAPQYPPDKGILAALLWQFLRGAVR